MMVMMMILIRQDLHSLVTVVRPGSQYNVPQRVFVL